MRWYGAACKRLGVLRNLPVVYSQAFLMGDRRRTIMKPVRAFVSSSIVCKKT